MGKALAAVGLLVVALGATATDREPSAAAPPPAPTTPAAPTVESRPGELADITPGSTTFSAEFEHGRVLNYWPEHAWEQAQARCAELDQQRNTGEDAIQN